jgi:hypothetical protein
VYLFLFASSFLEIKLILDHVNFVTFSSLFFLQFCIFRANLVLDYPNMWK